MLGVVAGPFQLTPLVYAHMLWFPLGYHGQTSLKLDIIHCYTYHTLKQAVLQKCWCWPVRNNETEKHAKNMKKQ